MPCVTNTVTLREFFCIENVNVNEILLAVAANSKSQIESKLNGD